MKVIFRPIRLFYRANNMNDLREKFEENPKIKNFMENFEVKFSNLGGYQFIDGKPCFWLNGAFEMFEDQQKIIESYRLVLSIQFGIDIAKRAFSNATITKTGD